MSQEAEDAKTQIGKEANKVPQLPSCKSLSRDPSPVLSPEEKCIVRDLPKWVMA